MTVDMRPLFKELELIYVIALRKEEKLKSEKNGHIELELYIIWSDLAMKKNIFNYFIQNNMIYDRRKQIGIINKELI